MALGVQYARPPVMDTNPPIAHASPTPVPVEEVSPLDAPHMQVGQILNATDAEKSLVSQSFDLANAVLASDCFKSKVLAAHFTETNNLSNEEIYALLKSKPIAVNVSFFNGSWYQNYVSKTMGYDIGDGTAYVNRFYVSTSLVLASLETHEAEGHGQGFHHYGDKPPSVPYQFNNFIESCAKELKLAWYFIPNGVLHAGLVSAF